MLYTSVFGVVALATGAFSHGLVTSPPVRKAGDAMSKACGAAVTALEVQDPTSHVEGMPEAAAATANFDATKCNVFLCKGMQFDDNTANVQTFTPGQLVNMRASIPIPHEGPMNVSVIDTKTNTAIGNPLIVFDSYADERLATLPANNTNFDVTIPTTLGSACSVAGDCVLQWFWFGTGAQQTYESWYVPASRMPRDQSKHLLASRNIARASTDSSSVDMVVAAGTGGGAAAPAPAPAAPAASSSAAPAVASPSAAAPVEAAPEPAPVEAAPVEAAPSAAPVEASTTEVAAAPTIVPVEPVAAVSSTASADGVCVAKTTLVTVTRSAAKSTVVAAAVSSSATDVGVCSAPVVVTVTKDAAQASVTEAPVTSSAAEVGVCAAPVIVTVTA